MVLYSDPQLKELHLCCYCHRNLCSFSKLGKIRLLLTPAIKLSPPTDISKDFDEPKYRGSAQMLGDILPKATMETHYD